MAAGDNNMNLENLDKNVNPIFLFNIFCMFFWNWNKLCVSVNIYTLL